MGESKNLCSASITQRDTGIEQTMHLVPISTSISWYFRRDVQRANIDLYKVYLECLKLCNCQQLAGDMLMLYLGMGDYWSLELSTSYDYEYYFYILQLVKRDFKKYIRTFEPVRRGCFDASSLGEGAYGWGEISIMKMGNDWFVNTQSGCSCTSAEVAEIDDYDPSDREEVKDLLENVVDQYDRITIDEFEADDDFLDRGTIEVHGERELYSHPIVTGKLRFLTNP